MSSQVSVLLFDKNVKGIKFREFGKNQQNFAPASKYWFPCSRNLISTFFFLQLVLHFRNVARIIWTCVHNVFTRVSALGADLILGSQRVGFLSREALIKYIKKTSKYLQLVSLIKQ